MLALKDYGSSDDDNSDSENEKQKKINNESNSTLETDSVVSLGIKICSAPEVVPMVS